jgi:RNA polymerase sigma factor (TIGR02999 family)
LNSRLVQQAVRGDKAALERVMSAVYLELRKRARAVRRKDPRGSMQTGSLVHEAFLKLVDRERIHWNDRVHFFSVAARAMRHIVIDAVRARRRAKRGAGVAPLELRESQVHVPARRVDLLDLDRALDRLSGLDPRLGRLVELRFFGGLSEAEAAAALGVSDRTLRRDWLKAKAVLLTMLDEDGRRQPTPTGSR